MTLKEYPVKLTRRTIAWHAVNAPHEGMRQLAQRASERGHSMRDLSRLCGRSEVVLTRYFESVAPRKETLVRLAEALDLPALVGRAMAVELNDTDRLNIRSWISEEIEIQRRALFNNPDSVSIGFGIWLHDRSLALRDRALSAYAIARFGLDRSEDIDGLGPSLSALERIVGPAGGSLAAHVADAARNVALKREGWSWFVLGASALGMLGFDLERDWQAIERIVAPYIGRLPKQTAEEAAAEADARGAALNAYRAALTKGR